MTMDSRPLAARALSSRTTGAILIASGRVPMTKPTRIHCPRTRSAASKRVAQRDQITCSKLMVVDAARGSPHAQTDAPLPRHTMSITATEWENQQASSTANCETSRLGKPLIFKVVNERAKMLLQLLRVRQQFTFSHLAKNCGQATNIVHHLFSTDQYLPNHQPSARRANASRRRVGIGTGRRVSRSTKT